MLILVYMPITLQDELFHTFFLLKPLMSTHRFHTLMYSCSPTILQTSQDLHPYPCPSSSYRVIKGPSPTKAQPLPCALDSSPVHFFKKLVTVLIPLLFCTHFPLRNHFNIKYIKLTPILKNKFPWLQILLHFSSNLSIPLRRKTWNDYLQRLLFFLSGSSSAHFYLPSTTTIEKKLFHLDPQWGSCSQVTWSNLSAACDIADYTPLLELFSFLGFCGHHSFLIFLLSLWRFLLHLLYWLNFLH